MPGPLNRYKLLRHNLHGPVVAPVPLSENRAPTEMPTHKKSFARILLGIGNQILVFRSREKGLWVGRGPCLHYPIEKVIELLELHNGPLQRITPTFPTRPHP